MKNRRYTLVQHTDRAPITECVTWRTDDVAEPGPGEVLTRTLLLSVDPANRGWMSSTPPSYMKGVAIGDTVRCTSIDEVVKSDHPDFAPGDIVEAMSGWQDYAIAPGHALRKIERRGELAHELSLYGLSGLTAYVGLMDIGRPKPGETLFVSAAAGSVGTIVGQLAKAAGCRVVGSAGSDAKCRWLTEELGFDAAVNYKDGPMRKALRELCPGGIDIYFDNTGGDALQSAVLLANERARIVCCGLISRWSADNPDQGIKGIPGLIAMKSMLMQGFIVFDNLHRRNEAFGLLSRLVADGRLKVRDDIVEGLENAPGALAGLFAGENMGKRIVRVAEPMAG
ncbi:NADP-dependent oxidoreductase [Rhizobiaceae sp. 2RAB30]